MKQSRLPAALLARCPPSAIRLNSLQRNCGRKLGVQVDVSSRRKLVEGLLLGPDQKLQPVVFGE